jgi:hypothetical protein
MKLFKKILVTILLLVVIAVIGGYIFLNHISNKGIPEYNGEINLKNLKEKVVVRRDAHAVPHIIAKKRGRFIPCYRICSCTGSALANGLTAKGNNGAFIGDFW